MMSKTMMPEVTPAERRVNELAAQYIRDRVVAAGRTREEARAAFNKCTDADFDDLWNGRREIYVNEAMAFADFVGASRERPEDGGYSPWVIFHVEMARAMGYDA